MIKKLLCLSLACFCLAGCATRAEKKEIQSDPVLQAILECGKYASDVLLDEEGKSRCDYNMTLGKWFPYEEPWHTGQLIYGLVRAYEVTGEKSLLDAAVRAGEWWLTLEIKDDARFKGMIASVHGDTVGNDHLVFATTTDGTHGLYELTRVTGDRRYADLATSAILWLYEHTYDAENGVCYDMVDLHTGEVLKTGSPFHADVQEQGLFDVSRPNTEGSPFKDAFEYGGDERLREAEIRLCDALVEYQDPVSGMWMQFSPNHAAAGSFHPRFNIWYAESLLDAFDMTGDRRYLEAAALTMRTYSGVQRADGTMFYDNYIDGKPSDKGSVCGSEVAFAGIVWMRLAEDYGYPEFKDNYERSASWLLLNRYAADHPDPNLRGAVVNTRMRTKKGRVWLTQRDVGTSFALRFLSDYHTRKNL